jgi:hypothetical protein
MKFLRGLEELEGKTIQSVKTVDRGESLAILFNDGTCAFFDVSHYGDSYSFELEDEPADDVKLEAGIISADQYQLIQTKNKENCRIALEARERGQLLALQQKYGK